MRILNDILEYTRENYPNNISHKYRKNEKFVTLRYIDFYNRVRILVNGFYKMGIRKNDHVLIYADNRIEWIIIDFALQSIGAVDVPRGKDSTKKELLYIAEHSDAKFAIIETPELLKKLGNKFTNIIKKKNIFVIEEGSNYNSFEDISDIGKREIGKGKDIYNKLRKSIGESDIATIIYTSGTTGKPKGVMLTQSNLVSNVRVMTPQLGIRRSAKEKTLSILPIWHVYERTFEYCTFSKGVQQVYTNIVYFAQDLENEKPTLISCVPRIWLMVYHNIIDEIKKTKPLKKAIFYVLLKIALTFDNEMRIILGRDTIIYKEAIFIRLIKLQKAFCSVVALFPLKLVAYEMFDPIRKKVAPKLRAAVSGGGALPPYVDNFFNTIGINIIEAYGLTETSPGISGRFIDSNVLHTVGKPFDETKVIIVDNEDNILPPACKGILKIKGPQVMPGYYKNKKATDAIIDKNGWLNTGDLALLTQRGEIIILGRAKDTIVLLSGENVEPTPIEKKLLESEIISQVIILGQDEKDLGALITLNENYLRKELEDTISDIENSAIVKRVRNEINRLINEETGFKAFERIKKFKILQENFQIGEELTQTLKPKRDFIVNKYKDFIEEMFEGKHKKK